MDTISSQEESGEDRRWHAIGRLAANQSGFVGMWQVRALGVSEAEIKLRVRRDGWSRPHRDVLGMPGVPPTPKGPVWAALLGVADRRVASVGFGPSGAPPGALGALADVVAVTGFSAAALLGFNRHHPTEVQLVAPASVVCRRDGIRLVRSRRGIVGMWEWRDGLPVATSPRLIWDAAHLLTGVSGAVRRLGDLVVFLDATREFAVEQVLGLVGEPSAHGLPRRPPPLLRATANELRPGFSHSRTEAKGRRIAESVAAELGITLEPSPYGITNAEGRVVGEADIACVALRFDAEIDGPHHDFPSQKLVDARRDGVVRDEDWIVCRYSYELIDNDPEEFRRLLRRDLQRAIQLRRAAAA